MTNQSARPRHLFSEYSQWLIIKTSVFISYTIPTADSTENEPTPIMLVIVDVPLLSSFSATRQLSPKSLIITSSTLPTISGITSYLIIIIIVMLSTGCPTTLINPIWFVSLFPTGSSVLGSNEIDCNCCD